MLNLYNTRTRKKEPLHIKDKQISVYVCGVTPYDTTHLGHAFTYAVFDTLVRYLRYRGYMVTYTQNVTDIDDPLFERAKKVGLNWRELGDKYLRQFLNDLQVLRVEMPNHFPRVTGEIPQIITAVKAIVDKGLGYMRQGIVYFDTKKFPSYGELAKFSKQKMIEISRERGNNPDDPNKKNPLDFILWQPSKKDEPSWDSPWGRGRPGWHIECSAMSAHYLGDQLTLHGGGEDLIFPHHESEIAQSETITGKKPFAYHFTHVALVAYQGKKMSKSLGNLILVRDLVKKYSAVAIRWFLLSHHYRETWEYFEEDIKEAQQTVEEIQESLKDQKSVDRKAFVDEQKKFQEAMDDDLDTPKALEVIKELSHKPNCSRAVKVLTQTLGLKFSRD